MSENQRPDEIVQFEDWLHKYVQDNNIKPGEMTRLERSTISNKAASFGLEISEDGKQYKLRRRGRVLAAH
jgi:hypothetical protein